MLRRTALSALPVLVVAVMTALAGTAVGNQSSPARAAATEHAMASPAPAGSNAGPPYDYVTVLDGQFVLIPLKDTS